jgi:hypothetical protein
MQISFSKHKKTDVLLILLITLLFIFAGCSGPKIKVSENNPPIFHTSGDYRITFFQISDDSGVVWNIYPKGKRVTLSDIATIKYGEVPSSWEQDFPKNLTPPPPLIEGKKYQAFAVIYDADVARVNFTIRDGKVVELPKER